MVESIGAKPVTIGDLKVAAVARVANTPATTQVQKQAEAPVAATLATQMAATPPVDSDRIQRIKEAIANGTFPISPATIADRLIALKYEWMSDDKA